MSTLGERVKELREAKGWIQEQLAENVTRRGYKIGQSAIGNIESGQTKNPKCIVQLAAALEVSPVWLQTGKGHKEPTGHNAPPTAPDLTPPDKTQRAFISYSGADLPKMLLDLLGKVPKGSDAEETVVDMLRRLKPDDGDK